MLPEQKLDALVARHKAIEHELASPVAPETYIKLSREFAELAPIVETVNNYRGVVAEIAGLDALIADAATDAVLPEAADVDINIDDDDLKIDTLRSGGAGGQHVNKTESAVRVTHIPSGIVVMMQEDRSQHRNRAKAMAVLRARLYDFERQKRDAARAAERRGQVGTGDRSERIRTYNFPQGRVSEHRINLTLYKLPQVIEGEALGEIIDALVTEQQAELLAAEAASS